MARLSALLALVVFLLSPALAKDKKPALPAYVLRAQTVRVVIDPDAGDPLDDPHANVAARDNVEKALMDWGRFRLVMDGQESDLVMVVRTGNGKAVRPTVKGWPGDQRPGIAQTTDSSIRIGAQQGRPPMNDPAPTPQSGPHISNSGGPTEDMLAVYRGDTSDTLDSPPVWRYAAKDCLREPGVSAIEEFRKAIVEAEKAQPAKKP